MNFSPRSILFVSYWLFTYYQRHLSARRPDVGALTLLVRMFWFGPRQLVIVPDAGVFGPVTGLEQGTCMYRHIGGHGYFVSLPVDFLCDELAFSVLGLLEDGQPLRRPHTPTLKEIVDEGAGRYRHIRRDLYFSTSDNVPLELAPKRLGIQEYLVSDPIQNDQLAVLNGRRHDFPTVTAWAFEKARVFFPSLTHRRLRTLPGVTQIEDVGIDLGAYGLGQLTVRRIDVSEPTINAFGWQVHGYAHDIRCDGGQRASAEVVLDVNHDGCLRVRRLRIHSPVGSLINASVVWDGDGLVSARCELACAQPMVQALADACGSADRYRIWLAEFINALRSSDMGMQLHIDDCDVDQMLIALDVAHPQEPVIVDLLRQNGRLAVRMNRVPAVS